MIVSHSKRLFLHSEYRQASQLVRQTRMFAVLPNQRNCPVFKIKQKIMGALGEAGAGVAGCCIGLGMGIGIGLAIAETKATEKERARKAS